MYRFARANEFIGKSGKYFVEKELHVTSNVLTIGKIVYKSERIFLECLAHDGEASGEVMVKVLSETVPGDESYVQIYGSLGYYRDEDFKDLYNFECHSETSDLFLVLNIFCWTDLQTESQARKFDETLYKLNNQLDARTNT